MEGDRLFIGTMDGDVRALDVESGNTVWNFPLRGDVARRAIYGNPVIKDGALYVGGYDGFMYVLDLDGREIWVTAVGLADPIVGGPAVADGLVLVGSSDGNLYAYDAADGSLKWKFHTGNRVWSTPVVANGVAFFGSLDHYVYAVNLEDGSELWRFKAQGAVTARPVIADDRVYLGSFGSVFYALDTGTGELVWRFDGASNWYWGGAVATEDTIYAPSLDGNLYALDIHNGTLRWTLRTQSPIIGSPVVVGDRIAVPTKNGRVVLVQLSDGSDQRQCDVDVDIRASLAVHEDLVFLSANDHSIRELRIKANGNPDEVWRHFSNQIVPVQQDLVRAC